MKPSCVVRTLPGLTSALVHNRPDETITITTPKRFSQLIQFCEFYSKKKEKYVKQTLIFEEKLSILVQLFKM